MVDAQTIGVLVTAASVTVAAVYYMLTLRTNQRNIKTTLETRQAQIFMGIYQYMMTKEFLDAEFNLFTVELKDADDWPNLQGDKESYIAWMTYGTLFEGLGVLVKENLIDIRLPAQMMSGPIVWFWERYRQGIYDCREKLNWPKLGTEIEYLYNRTVEFGREHPELKITSPSITVSQP